MKARITSLPSSAGALNTYLRLVRNIPSLSREKECELVENMACDHNARHQLLVMHLNQVVRIANTYGGYGLPLEDLVQEGNIGLLRAMKQFDPNVGVRLATYSRFWIRAEIHGFVIRNIRQTRAVTTKAKYKLFFRLRSFQSNPGWMTAAERREAAQVLNVRIQDVEEMDMFLNNRDLPVDTAVRSSGEELNLHEVLADRSAKDPLDELEAEDKTARRKAMIAEAISQLDRRAQAIIAGRFLNDGKRTRLADLSERFGISLQRVHQIEKESLSQLGELLAA